MDLFIAVMLIFVFAFTMGTMIAIIAGVMFIEDIKKLLEKHFINNEIKRRN